MDNFVKAVFDYSLKNIPVPSENTYLKSLVYECERFIQRIRWRAYFYLNGKPRTPKRETYGFNTPHNAPQCNQLVNFENDITHLISNLEYRKVNNTFQQKLSADVRKINNSKNLFVTADKTTNVYEVTPKHYEKLLRDNVTSLYEKTDEATVKAINLEAKAITTELEISDRVEPIAHNPAYVTIKDHKENFPRNVKCRLINPAKSNIGKISKKLLQNINAQLRDRLELNQWRSTYEVIDWFNSLDNKTRRSFIQLDICEYYPSISEDLFSRALSFAGDYVIIEDQHREILMNARKSLLFSNGIAWKKKTGLFDTTMGAYDGCEVCELVGILILHKMKNAFPDINFGLYRDDGLGVHKRIPATQLNIKVREIQKLFQGLGLQITVQTKLTNVDFLDVNFDLHKETHRPFRKANDKTVYVNTKSNHPKSVLSQIPVSVNKRLNAISSSEQIFNDAKTEYGNALKASGHKDALKYEEKQPEDDHKRKTRRRKRREEIFFNPPYNAALKSNLGKEFLKLIDKNFPISHQLHKIINRHTIKISYSCTENMGQVIKKHNAKVLRSEKEKTAMETRLCNCRRKEDCPVGNRCLEESVVYKATLDCPNGGKAEYIGVTDNSFKTRFNNHNHSFREEKKKSSTTLSTYIWENKANPSPTVKWELKTKCPKYMPGMRTCQLCLMEKVEIIKNLRRPNTLNKRTDIGNKCTFHTKKHRLDLYE